MPTPDGWVSVTDYGAVPDGQSNSTVPIRNALMAAQGSPPKTLYFPSGTYIYDSPLPLDISNVGGVASWGANLAAGSSQTTDAFLIQSGSFDGRKRMYDLPSVWSFVNGAGLHLSACSLAMVRMSSINTCKDGVLISTDSSTGAGIAQDNSVWVNFISSATVPGTTGIRFLQTSTSDIIQGNYFACNFLVGADRPIYFDTPATSPIKPVTSTVVLDVLNTGANTANPNISAAPNYRLFGLEINIRGFTGGASGPVISFAPDQATYCIFRLGNMDTNGLVAQGYAAISVPGAGNYVAASNPRAEGTAEAPPGRFAAMTVPNSRASFNGGYAFLHNCMACVFTTPTNLSAGQTVLFYVYSPFTIGDPYTKSVQFQMDGEPAGGAAVAPTGCRDNSANVPNEIIVSFTAITFVAAGTTWTGIVEVGS